MNVNHDRQGPLRFSEVDIQDLRPVIVVVAEILEARLGGLPRGGEGRKNEDEDG